MADWLHDSQDSCRDLYRNPSNSAELEIASLPAAARSRFAEIVSIIINLRESENQRLKVLVQQLKRCSHLSKIKVQQLAMNVFDDHEANSILAQPFWEDIIKTALLNLPLLLEYLFIRFKICFHPVVAKKLRDDKYCFSYEKPHNSISVDQFIGPFADIHQVSGLREYSVLCLHKSKSHFRAASSPVFRPSGVQHDLRVIDRWLVSIRHVYEQIRTVFCDSYHFVQACAMKIALEVLTKDNSQAHVAPLDSLKRYFKENIK